MRPNTTLSRITAVCLTLVRRLALRENAGQSISLLSRNIGHIKSAHGINFGLKTATLIIYCGVRSKVALENKETIRNYCTHYKNLSYNRLLLLIESLSVIVVKMKQ